MDPHPADILRLHLAIGVIESLSNLSAATRQAYVRDVEAIAVLASNGATHIELKGAVEVNHTDWRNINVQIPLVQAQDAARRAGAYIATAKLAALLNKSIQDIETWDDVDESAAADIASRIMQNASIVSAGDDAQLLAGGTMAVLARPRLYANASNLVNDALDESYKTDPIWAGLSLDLMLSPGFLAALAKPNRLTLSRNQQKKSTATQKRSNRRKRH